MKIKNKLCKRLVLTVLIFLIVGYIISPIYVHYAACGYARLFGVVLNSHNKTCYNLFFSNNAMFEVDGKRVKYSDVRDNILKLDFNSGSSYGHLDENINNVYTTNIYECGLYLPIMNYNNENGVHNFMLEAELVLERRLVFFFRIKEVKFYDDYEGFLEEALGFGI